MKRCPCDNCQQYEHWKYMPECPNFHLYLAIQQAVLNTFRNGAGGSAGGTIYRHRHITCCYLANRVH
jgi:hypothetical protein